MQSVGDAPGYSFEQVLLIDDGSNVLAEIGKNCFRLVILTKELSINCVEELAANASDEEGDDNDSGDENDDTHRFVEVELPYEEREAPIE